MLLEIDDAATDQSIVVPGVTLVANDILALKIDFEDATNVKFYINKNPVARKNIYWYRVGESTRFNYAASGANAILQPTIAAAKASGAGVGTLHTDYVNYKTWRF